MEFVKACRSNHFPILKCRYYGGLRDTYRFVGDRASQLSIVISCSLQKCQAEVYGAQVGYQVCVQFISIFSWFRDNSGLYRVAPGPASLEQSKPNSEHVKFSTSSVHARIFVIVIL